jgi:tetratricopeptide (TPR) repeat protein
MTFSTRHEITHHPASAPTACRVFSAQRKQDLIISHFEEVEITLDPTIRLGRRGLMLAILLAGSIFSAAQDIEDRIQNLYAQSAANEKNGNLEEAIQDYREIIKLNPELPAAYNNLGRLYYRHGQFPEAIESLKRACQFAPKLASPRALIGFVYFEMGDFENAQKELKIASQLNSADRNAKLFLARSMIELQDPKGALKILEQLQREDPDDVEVLYTLGTLYSSLSETSMARIQTVDPNSYLIELLLGQFSQLKGVYQDAAEHYRRAIEKSPNLPDLYYRYAHVLWAGGEAEAALAQYRRALELNPYDYRSAWEAARVLLADNPEEALKLASQALKVKGDVPEALTIRGRALLSVHKPQEAIDDLNKAAALDPQDSSTHFQLARAYRQVGRPQDAQRENSIYEKLEAETHAEKEKKTPQTQ